MNRHFAKTKHREAEIDRLVEDHYRPLYRFLFGLTRRSEDAEDLTQQTFVRALKGMHRFDGRAPIRNWLLGIGYREFLSFRRRRLWLPLPFDRPTTDDPFGNLLEAHSLLDALTKLPSDSRSAFLLHHIEDLSIPEISVAIGIPEGTVKSRLFHARQRLRFLLGEDAVYATEPI